MSRRSGAADRALDLPNDWEALAADATRLSGAQLARVAGPELQAAGAALALQDASSGFQLGALADGETVIRCGCPACMKAMQQADAGHIASAPAPHAADDVPDDTSSTVGINVLEGQTIQSTLNDPTDQDFFVFQASAGETYDFTLTPTDASATGPDQLLQIVDAEGNVVQEQDGGGQGSDEAITFAPTADGTYYINVKGYLALGAGGYSLEGKLHAGAPDPNSGTPLDAIDWGTRVDTDGVTNAEGDEVIHYYFCKTGEVSEHPITPTTVASGMQQFEKDAMITSFTQYENIVNVDFQEVDSQEEADFIFTTSPNAPVLLGAMSPPGESAEGVGWFNNAGVGWDEAGLAQGGYGFITFTHELGHGMGLAHPHDNGGNSTVMNGVDSDTDSGDYGLNQGVFTVMTYNDGWPDGPNGKSPDNGFGWSGTLMAMDVAVLQQKYGANMDYKTGDDTYTLWSENAPGTMYACIWDAGGKDTIAAGDALNVSIDLREATLKYEIGGGGYVSYADGIIGGYTVANGVKIENAEGGAGADLLTGNDYSNRMFGLDGDDFLSGGGGKDVLRGGAGADEFDGGLGKDRLIAGEGKDLLTGGDGSDRFIFREAIESDRITDLQDGEIVRLSRLDANVNKAGNQEFTMVDHFTDVAGQAVIMYNTTQDVTRLSMDTDGDGRADMVLLMDGDHTAFDGFTGFVS